MTSLPRILSRRVVSDATAARFAKHASYVAGPTVLVLGLRGVSRFAATPGEVLLGVLASSTVALLLVLMGMVLEIAQGRADASMGR